LNGESGPRPILFESGANRDKVSVARPRMPTDVDALTSKPNPQRPGPRLPAGEDDFIAHVERVLGGSGRPASAAPLPSGALLY
jgi:hypothetical protein